MSGISDEPLLGRGVSVTIKYGKGYDDTWARFQGTAREVREQITEFFGINPDDRLTLSDLVVNATQVAHGKATIAATFEGTTVQPSTTNDEGQSYVGGDAWAGIEGDGASVAAPEPENPSKALMDTIASISDVNELKRLWVDNQSAFAANSELMDAYKARGKELSK